MTNSGVIVVISGQDNTEKVFRAIDANMKRTSVQAHETGDALTQLGERATKALEYAGISLGIHETIDLLKDAVKSSLEFGETIAKAGEKTGLSAGTLSTLHYAAVITNSDFDKLSGSVAKFDKVIGDAADGNKKAQGLMQALGLNAKDLVGRTDGAEIAFKKFSETIASTENPIRRAQLAQDLLGKSGKDLIPVLVEVGTNYDEFKAKAQAAGLYLDGPGAEALKRQAEAFKEVGLAIQGLELAFTQGLLPGLEGAAKGFTGLGLSAQEFNTVGKEIGKFLISTSSDLSLLVEWLRLAKAEWDSWSSHINAAGDKIDATIGFTAGQRSVAKAHYDQDVKDSQNAVTEYKKAQEEYTAAQKNFHDALANYDKPAPAPKPKPKPGKGFEGVTDETAEAKLDAARKARDAAQLRLDEQMAQLRAQMAKAAQEKNLAQLEADHKKNLISDQAFYTKKLAIEKTALDQQRQSAIDKQGEIDKGIGKFEVDAKKKGGAVAIEDQAKILELRTKRLALDGEIAKINADGAKAEITAAQQLYELSIKQVEQADALAAKREEITGGSATARLRQSADTYDIKRKDLVANFGEGSPEVSNSDFAFSNEQGHTRAKAADETSGLDLARVTSERTALADAEARGSTTTLDAQRQRIALDAEEAQALQPVLEAYQQLAQTGDLQASEKVLELKTRIAELKNPVDEVSAHIRESFDGAFESLFTNLDQGLKGFENFTKGIEKILEQAAYKKFLEPLVQKGLSSLIPSTNKAPAYGDPGIGGIGPVPNPGADIGGGAVKTALGGIGGLLGIPGLSGLGKKAGGANSITIQLVNDSDTQLKLGDINTQGQVDKDQVLTIIQDSFGEGGVMRSLLTGFGA
jgi:hypothetical protein